jgi:hypothetical protein
VSLRKGLKWATLAALLCASLGAAQAQTAREFKKKYGPPDEKGRYTARLGIVVKPTYAEDRQVCKMTIMPKPPSASVYSDTPLMKPEIVAEIIGDFAPDAKGGLNRPSLTMGGYVSVEEYDYKQVTAYVRTRQMPDGSKRISSAEVVWKARKCK